jgi:hypothetical protein
MMKVLVVVKEKGSGLFVFLFFVVCLSVGRAVEDGPVRLEGLLDGHGQGHGLADVIIITALSVRVGRIPGIRSVVQWTRNHLGALHVPIVVIVVTSRHGLQCLGATVAHLQRHGSLYMCMYDIQYYTLFVV